MNINRLLTPKNYYLSLLNQYYTDVSLNEIKKEKIMNKISEKIYKLVNFIKKKSFFFNNNIYENELTLLIYYINNYTISYKDYNIKHFDFNKYFLKNEKIIQNIFLKYIYDEMLYNIKKYTNKSFTYITILNVIQYTAIKDNFNINIIRENIIYYLNNKIKIVFNNKYIPPHEIIIETVPAKSIKTTFKNEVRRKFAYNNYDTLYIYEDSKEKYFTNVQGKNNDYIRKYNFLGKNIKPLSAGIITNNELENPEIDIRNSISLIKELIIKHRYKKIKFLTEVSSDKKKLFYSNYKNITNKIKEYITNELFKLKECLFQYDKKQITNNFNKSNQKTVKNTKDIISKKKTPTPTSPKNNDDTHISSQKINLLPIPLTPKTSKKKTPTPTSPKNNDDTYISSQKINLLPIPLTPKTSKKKTPTPTSPKNNDDTYISSQKINLLPIPLTPKTSKKKTPTPTSPKNNDNTYISSQKINLLPISLTPKTSKKKTPTPTNHLRKTLSFKKSILNNNKIFINKLVKNIKFYYDNNNMYINNLCLNNLIPYYIYYYKNNNINFFVNIINYSYQNTSNVSKLNYIRYIYHYNILKYLNINFVNNIHIPFLYDSIYISSKKIKLYFYEYFEDNLFNLINKFHKKIDNYKVQIIINMIQQLLMAIISYHTKTGLINTNINSKNIFYNYEKTIEKNTLICYKLYDKLYYINYYGYIWYLNDFSESKELPKDIDILVNNTYDSYHLYSEFKVILETVKNKLYKKNNNLDDYINKILLVIDNFKNNYVLNSSNQKIQEFDKILFDLLITNNTINIFTKNDSNNKIYNNTQYEIATTNKLYKYRGVIEI